jgi:hypothetical protein
MSEPYWETHTDFTHRKAVERPSWAQVLRQIAVIALLAAVWAVLLVGYLQLTEEPSEQAIGVQPEPNAVVLVPTSTPTLAPTHTPTPTVPSATPTQEVVPPSATAQAPAATDEPSLSPEPSATPSATPSPTPPPVPTDTPLPPTDTPVPTEASDQTSFSRDVLPILQNRCVKCHGGERTEEGLVMTTYADLMAGSWNGPVIVPGNADDSYLVEQIVTGEMPKRAPRLLPAEIRFITEWVNAGALDN